MARGTEAKEKIAQQILSTFSGSFRYDKEIRVPIMENGELIQIKVTLTAAKTNVDVGGDVAIPGTVPTPTTVTNETPSSEKATIAAPTAEEKVQVANLLASLGL